MRTSTPTPWRGCGGRFTPDVLVSIADGCYFGDPFMAAVMGCSAAHGNLNLRGSSGFAMTTAGKLPPVLRMADLHGALRAAGVPLKPRPEPKAP
jgi:hypothetical protein